jgi:hypothetical protein
MPIIPISGSATAKGALVPIASFTASSAASFDFANIPATYQDLMLVISGSSNGTTDTGTGLWTRINLDTTGTKYSYTGLRNSNGDGGTSFRSTNESSFWVTDTLYGNMSQQGTMIFNFSNYASTTNFKQAVMQMAGSYTLGSNTVQMYALTYRSTTAISRITLFGAGGNGQYTTCTGTLYGVRSIGQ